MRRNGVLLLAALSLGFAALAQDASKPAQAPAPAAVPAAYKIPPDAVKEPNPVKPNSESLAGGKRMYGYDCAMCHGATGDGKGDLAADMKSPLGDFRDPKTLQGQSDGELFYIIENGKGEMPAEGARAKPNQVWDMVNYVRSLAKKEVAPKK
jgi:mono/diheme cytochrome c family protein